MATYESTGTGSAETSQAGQTAAEKLAAHIPLSIEGRRDLNLEDSSIAAAYLATYGGSRAVAGAAGTMTVCDGHYANRADEIDRQVVADSDVIPN